AVELVHNFSLIHDDIQDNSPLRRGRKTVWKKWGVPQAINTGDSMFSLAHIALHRLEALAPPKIVLRAQKILPMACLTLTQGQYMDLSYENRTDLTIDDYWSMIHGKTASLLATCSQLGALMANVNPETQELYRAFGEYVGLAFQVYDDILGIWGDAVKTGKSTESDLITGKNSLPVLFGLQESKVFTQRWKDGQIQAKEVPEIIRILDDCGAHEFAKEKTAELTQKALDTVAEANPSGEAAEALIELAHALINRET
ncbi:MAG: polyprenyl synthetase family protein, partial [Chloroflexota bacterium]